MDKLFERAMPELHDFVFQKLDKIISRDSFVLDIAAGTGAFAKRLHENGYKVFANEIDLPSWGVSDIKPTTFNLDDPFFELFESSGVKPDLILAIEVIEHLENPLFFLRECFAMLKKGAVLIITTPNINTARSRLGFLRHGRPAYFNEQEYPLPQGHKTILPFWLLEMHAREVGFSDIQIEFAGLPHAPKKTFSELLRHLVLTVLKPVMKSKGSTELLNGSSVLTLYKK